MAPRTLAEPYQTLMSHIVETMLEGNGGQYPESHSDMNYCIRGLLKMYDVKRRSIAIELPYADEADYQSEQAQADLDYIRNFLGKPTKNSLTQSRNMQKEEWRVDPIGSGNKDDLFEAIITAEEGTKLIAQVTIMSVANDIVADHNNRPTQYAPDLGESSASDNLSTPTPSG